MDDERVEEIMERSKQLAEEGKRVEPPEEEEEEIEKDA
jgi:hypothetical protein